MSDLGYHPVNDRCKFRQAHGDDTPKDLRFDALIFMSKDVGHAANGRATQLPDTDPLTRVAMSLQLPQ